MALNESGPHSGRDSKRPYRLGLSRSQYDLSRSFENLVALANYQERLKEARKMVWRDRGEPVAELYNLWDCLEHAVKGGMRTLTPTVPKLLRLTRCRGRSHGVQCASWNKPCACHDTSKIVVQVRLCVTVIAAERFYLHRVSLAERDFI
jgi:hypothetical protein